MRGTVAKRLRREVYGDQATNAAGRGWFLGRRRTRWEAGELRQEYQRRKRAHHPGPTPPDVESMEEAIAQLERRQGQRIERREAP